MRNFIILIGILVSSLCLSSCGVISESMKKDRAQLLTFGQDLAFFKQCDAQAFLLSDGNAYLALSAKWQARVLTSSFDASDGVSIAWINRDAMTNEKTNLSNTQIGGEDRLLIGPMGGEHSVFFPKDMAMNEQNFRYPAEFASEPWELLSRTKTQARFFKKATLENVKGKKFDFEVQRDISLLNHQNVSEILGIEIPETMNLVAFQSINKITNTGEDKWTRQTGLLNLSVYSCYNANRTTNVFLPYKQGEDLGTIVSDDYVGTTGIGDSKLTVENDYVRFKTDSMGLSLIGMTAKRSKGIALSYDSYNNILTVIITILPTRDVSYLSSSWSKPDVGAYGDAINVFNNGPTGFAASGYDFYYEINTHSPALDLDAKKSQYHIQRTFHFNGSEYDLSLISYKLTGLTIQQLRSKE